MTKQSINKVPAKEIKDVTFAQAKQRHITRGYTTFTQLQSQRRSELFSFS